MTRNRSRPGAALVLLAALSLFVTADASGQELFLVSGTVRDAFGQPVAGAVVAVSEVPVETRTDETGAWRLRLPSGEHALRASRPGFEGATRRITVSADTAAVDFSLSLAYRHTEKVVVQAVRADALAPVTKTDIGPEEIARLDYGQKMPFLLEQAPSITQYSDTGLGAGYAYMYLRGIQQTRLNMTLDGVPLNDAEDSAVYFVDFGNFASSLESIQIQRGVGTSTVGAASFGGSLNFASVALQDSRQLAAEAGGGSFGTGRVSLSGQSGRLGPGLAFYGRASYQQTDGFRDRSGVIERSIFFGASWQGKRSFLKVFGFAGGESTQLAFLATEKDVLEADLRFNPLTPADRDSFGEDFAQAQYTRFLSSSSSLTAQGYYVGAQGTYQLQSDPELLQYGLDWHFLGGMINFHHAGSRLSVDAGVHANDFGSHHTQDVVGAARAYANEGHKNEANAFAKVSYAVGRWRLYADGQLRWARFGYEGDIDLGSVDWTFFNPKLGARFEATPRIALYASLGRATREPARSDMLAGEDNATSAYDLGAVEPEKVTDLEAGVEYRRTGLTVKANLYAMEFRNEIALTGELSDIGLPLRRNVGQSYRRGLELDLTWQALPKLLVRGSGNLSHNRISEWTQFYDVYDPEGAYAGSASVRHLDVPPLLTPAVVANLGVEWTPASAASLTLTGRYVAAAQLDNTGDESFETPAFFKLDASASVDFSRWIKAGHPRLRVQVNNVLDNRRIWPSGYSYIFFTRDAQGRDTLSGIPYYYPLATTSVFVVLDLRL